MAGPIKIPNPNQKRDQYYARKAVHKKAEVREQAEYFYFDAILDLTETPVAHKKALGGSSSIPIAKPLHTQRNESLERNPDKPQPVRSVISSVPSQKDNDFDLDSFLGVVESPVTHEKVSDDTVVIPAEKHVQTAQNEAYSDAYEVPESAVEVTIKPKTKVKKKKLNSGILAFGKTLAIQLTVVFILVNFVVRPVRIVGSSMYPTYTDGSIGISNVFAATIGDIDRFDVVILKIPETNRLLIKRVVGLPGETISYSHDKLYVNGKVVEEPFLQEQYTQAYSQFTSDIMEVKLGDDEYYCLGDNRPNSSDSRVYGPFKKSQIISKSAYIFLF